MTVLIISILSSTLLFFIFRLFPKFGVDTAQAIVVNYFTAFICGCIVENTYPDFGLLVEKQLHWWALLSGFLFISLFAGMGFSSFRNGVGVTSVTVKMSMALTMIFFVILYDEAVTASKFAGFILAIGGVLLISSQPGQEKGKPGAKLLLFYLFAGSSVLDLVLNYVDRQLDGFPSSIYTAIGFLMAGMLGLVWMIVDYSRGKRQFSYRNIIGGILLGIPNYFSIYYLVRSYSVTGWSASSTLAVTAISIVTLSSLFGIIIFKESAKPVKLAGLVAALTAIVLLAAV